MEIVNTRQIRLSLTLLPRFKWFIRPKRTPICIAWFATVALQKERKERTKKFNQEDPRERSELAGHPQPQQVRMITKVTGQDHYGGKCWSYGSSSGNN